MAQTTGALSARNAVIEVSTNGSSWTNISGSANSVEPGENTRQHAESYTFDGDYAIITVGKREPMEVEVKIIYTEVGGEAFETVRAAHEGNSVLYLRWAPKGSTTGNFRFTTDQGLITAFQYPAVNSSEPGPVMAGFKLKVNTITKATIP